MGGQKSKMCHQMRDECSCWIETQEEVNSSGFHLLEIHNNSTGLSALYIFAIVGFVFLIYVIYIKCKGRYVFNRELQSSDTRPPLLPIHYMQHPEPRIVEIRGDENELRENQNRQNENWQNNI